GNGNIFANGAGQPVYQTARQANQFEAAKTVDRFGRFRLRSSSHGGRRQKKWRITLSRQSALVIAKSRVRFALNIGPPRNAQALLFVPSGLMHRKQQAADHRRFWVAALCLK